MSQHEQEVQADKIERAMLRGVISEEEAEELLSKLRNNGEVNTWN